MKGLRRGVALSAEMMVRMKSRGSGDCASICCSACAGGARVCMCVCACVCACVRVHVCGLGVRVRARSHAYIYVCRSMCTTWLFRGILVQLT